MGSEEKTRVMVRVPDNVCRVMDTLAGHTHVSRPDVVIDACRQFYAALCQREPFFTSPPNGTAFPSQTKAKRWT